MSSNRDSLVVTAPMLAEARRFAGAVVAEYVDKVDAFERSLTAPLPAWAVRDMASMGVDVAPMGGQR